MNEPSERVAVQKDLALDPKRWKRVLAFFVACTLGVSGAWFFLLTTICSNPRTPTEQAGHAIPYSCHGMTVFISSFEQAMLEWLIPIGGLFVLLTVIAAAMVALASVKVRIDVRIRHRDGSAP